MIYIYLFQIFSFNPFFRSGLKIYLLEIILCLGGGIFINLIRFNRMSSSQEEKQFRRHLEEYWQSKGIQNVKVPQIGNFFRARGPGPGLLPVVQERDQKGRGLTSQHEQALEGSRQRVRTPSQLHLRQLHPPQPLHQVPPRLRTKVLLRQKRLPSYQGTPGFPYAKTSEDEHGRRPPPIRRHLLVGPCPCQHSGPEPALAQDRPHRKIQ